jgi:hypothetical protein
LLDKIIKFLINLQAKTRQWYLLIYFFIYMAITFQMALFVYLFYVFRWQFLHKVNIFALSIFVLFFIFVIIQFILYLYLNLINNDSKLLFGSSWKMLQSSKTIEKFIILILLGLEIIIISFLVLLIITILFSHFLFIVWNN